MPLQPQSSWKSAYEPGLKAYYAAFQTDQTKKVIDFWSKWVDDGVKGLETAAPYGGGKSTTDPGSFSPLPLEASHDPATTAALLVAAWTAYMNAIAWDFSTMTVAAPFSVITAVITSPLGLAAATPVLLAGLIAELTLLPPAPGFDEKAGAFATLFRTATLAAGVQIAGLATSGTPPPPVVVPLSPTQ